MLFPHLVLPARTHSLNFDHFTWYRQLYTYILLTYIIIYIIELLSCGQCAYALQHFKNKREIIILKSRPCLLFSQLGYYHTWGLRFGIGQQPLSLQFKQCIDGLQQPTTYLF